MKNTKALSPLAVLAISRQNVGKKQELVLTPRQILSPISLVPPLPALRSICDLLPLAGPLPEEKRAFLGDISNWTAAEIDGAEDRLRALFPQFFNCEKEQR